MKEVFEMNRRARRPLKCDECGEVIEVGQRSVFRREKESGFWQNYNLCEECAVFGPPNYSIYDLGPLAPDNL